MTATNGTDRPTLERRLLEATYEAFQFDPEKRSSPATQKTLAQSIAALLLRRVYDVPSGRIAELIGCGTDHVPTMFEYAQRVSANAPGIKAITDRLQAEAPDPAAPRKYTKHKKPAKEKKPPKKRAVKKHAVAATGVREAFDDNAMRSIIRRVSEALDVSPTAMASDSRGTREANARAVAVGVALALHPTWEPEDIGAPLRRDPALVRLTARLLSESVRLKNGTGLYRNALTVCAAMGIQPESLVLS